MDLPVEGAFSRQQGVLNGRSGVLPRLTDTEHGLLIKIEVSGPPEGQCSSEFKC